ncbi:MAG: COG4280 domain-containing protein [Ferrimicrobium sp.]
MNLSVLILSVFLATAVEMVEALTIVLAVAATKGWRSATLGALGAVGLLAVMSGIFGQALVYYVPIDSLRVVVGSILLIFGLQWLRKAILRAAGVKAMHDEAAIYKREVAELSSDVDAQGVLIAFKGVLLEGLEVVVIVITLGASAHAIGVAALSALAAFVVVGGVGLMLARVLSGVPENKMKMAVGIMLTSFGTYWGAAGLGIGWPGGDAFLVVLVAWYAAVALMLVRVGLSRSRAQASGGDL